MGKVAERGTFSTSGSAATPWVVPLTAAATITVGNTLILAAAFASDRTITGISDPAGNTWNIGPTPAFSSNVGARFAWCKVASGYTAGAELTVTMSATTLGGLTVAEYTPVVAVDRSSVGDSGGATGTAVSSGATASTAASSLMLVGVVAHNSTTTVTPDDGAGVWTAAAPFAATDFLRTVAPFWRDVTAAGAFEFAATLGTARTWSALIVAFEAAGGVDPPSGLTVTPEGAGLRSSWTSAEAEFVLGRERWTGAGSPP